MEIKNEKRENIKLALYFLIAVVFVACATSCGTRKVNKSETKISEIARTETVIVDSSKTVTKTDTNTKIIDSSSSEEFTISPIDSTKEMVVMGKSYFNASIKRIKHKTAIVSKIKQSVNTATQNAIKTNSKAETSKQTTVEVKQSERKSGFPWWILIIIACIVSVFIYFELKKAPKV